MCVCKQLITICVILEFSPTRITGILAGGRRKKGLPVRADGWANGYSQGPAVVLKVRAWGGEAGQWVDRSMWAGPPIGHIRSVDLVWTNQLILVESG